jgi:peptidase M28-like protein
VRAAAAPAVDVAPSVDEGAVARTAVQALATIPDRGSATSAELAAADWIASRLRSIGLDPRVEIEFVHGTHWWPYGLPPAAAAIAGAMHLSRRGRLSRALAVLVGALGAAAVIEDVEGSRRILRGSLPQRRTANVIAEAGDPDGTRTLVIHAHHDAAHGGLMFHPAVSRPDGPVPPLGVVAGGPALVALAAAAGRRRTLRAGVGLAALTAALFADSGARRPVPGANDDASGVAALLILAQRLVADPPGGVRVVLLSTGSEESMLEGMAAFARRHLPRLPPAATGFISVDSLGWELLALRSGEGALRQRPASPELVALLRECAQDLGHELREGLRSWIPTDGLIPLRSGYAQVNLGSVQRDGTFPAYHTNDDTPDRVHIATITAGAALLDAAVRRLRRGS